jgi:uncharacterized protein YdeI (BOF family)
MEAHMKKFGILAIVLLMAVGSVFAADLTVNGSIPANLTVAVTSSTILITLDGTGAGASGGSTATLNAKSNKKAWTVSFDSVNGGLLISPTVSGVTIPYLLQASTPVLSGATITNGLSTAVDPEGKTIAVTNGKTPKDGVDFTLTASIVAQNGADTLFEAATDYTDTIHITIAAN